MKYILKFSSGILLMLAFSSFVIFCHSPRVSIITSIFKGDKFIAHFLEDITKQTIFNQCELILINANSPDNEEKIIRKYLAQYPNIVYIRLGYDPGLYGVWNMGIKLARAEYLTNANLDDRLREDCYQIHADYLDAHEDIDLVYSGVHVSFIANEKFYDQKKLGKPAVGTLEPFDADRMLTKFVCYPSCHPMWRKRMNKNYGLFDQQFKASGDLEMWIRAACAGTAKFSCIPESLGLMYINPNGLSTKADTVRYTENSVIRSVYVDKNYRRKKVIEYLPEEQS